MSKQIKTLFVSEPGGVNYMLGQGQFEQIDEFHIKFDAVRNVTLKDIVIQNNNPFGQSMMFESLEVRLIESVTATIVDVYGKLETRNVEETILDLEFLDIDRELNLYDRLIKSILIDRLNESDRLEKLVGNIAVIAR